MNAAKYFILATIFWVVVDYTTVYFPDYSEWVDNMPGVWVVYFCYPLIFSLVFYKWKLGGALPVIIMLSFLTLIEIVIVRNPLLLTFPDLLVGMPIALAIYMLITYVPKYLIDGEISKRKGECFIYIGIWMFAWFATAVN